MYITRLASNEIFSPSNKIHREVGRAKDLSAPLYVMGLGSCASERGQGSGGCRLCRSVTCSEIVR